MNAVTIKKGVNVFAGLTGVGAGIVITNIGKAFGKRSLIEAISVGCFAAVYGVSTYVVVKAIGEKIVDDYPKWKKEKEQKEAKESEE